MDQFCQCLKVWFDLRSQLDISLGFNLIIRQTMSNWLFQVWGLTCRAFPKKAHLFRYDAKCMFPGCCVPGMKCINRCQSGKPCQVLTTQSQTILPKHKIQFIFKMFWRCLTVTKQQEFNALAFGNSWNTPLGDFCGYSYNIVSQGKINTQSSHHHGWASQWESVGALVQMEVLIFDILFIQHSQSFPRAENNVWGVN